MLNVAFRFNERTAKRDRQKEIEAEVSNVMGKHVILQCWQCAPHAQPNNI